MKILTVDDNATNLKLLRAVLESEGYEVVEASDGLEALEVLGREMVDVIISDILMPNMDGYKLCNEIRRSDKLNHLPFITYTSTYTSPADEKFALEVGADKYLRKPAQAHVLVAALQEFASDPKYKTMRHTSERNDPSVLESYNKVLVEKLQEKNADLEHAKAEITKMNQVLEQRVKERTEQLEYTNQELEAFSHSAAHDLRAPLRTIDGYGALLEEILNDRLDPESRLYLHRIRGSAKKMNALIDDLLKLSHVGRCDIAQTRVDLSAMADAIIGELRQSDPDRSLRAEIAPGIFRTGDEALLRIALQNLLGNAWKFTSAVQNPLIEFSTVNRNGVERCFVRDNGAGFDPAFGDKLMTPFQRLHSQEEFPGTGLGLTIVKRILSRHGGNIWLESEVGVGTTVYFELP